jgi:hypothetical protein
VREDGNLGSGGWRVDGWMGVLLRNLSLHKEFFLSGLFSFPVRLFKSNKPILLKALFYAMCNSFPGTLDSA